MRPHNPRTRYKRGECGNRPRRAPASAPTWMAAASRIRLPQPLERGRERPLALPALALEPTPATDQGKNRVEAEIGIGH